jgi:hypothetical protein
MSPLNQLAGIELVESPYARVGSPILVRGGRQQLFAHPLDVLLLTQPELSPVERVMVLVDRVVNRALRRVDV